MDEPPPPRFSRLRSEAASLGSDLLAMLSARAELAQLEAAQAAGEAKRLAVMLVVAGGLLAAGGAVLLVTAADCLSAWYGLSSGQGQLLLGTSVVLLASVLAWLACRRFRREFRGLEASAEELREDAALLREWLTALQGREPKDT